MRVNSSLSVSWALAFLITALILSGSCCWFSNCSCRTLSRASKALRSAFNWLSCAKAKVWKSRASASMCSANCTYSSFSRATKAMSCWLLSTCTLESCSFALSCSICVFNSRSCRLGSIGATKGPGLKAVPCVPKAWWYQIARVRAKRKPSIASLCWVLNWWVALLPSIRKVWKRSRILGSSRISRFNLNSKSACEVFSSKLMPLRAAISWAKASPSWRSLMSVVLGSAENSCSAAKASWKNTGSCSFKKSKLLLSSINPSGLNVKASVLTNDINMELV